MDAATAAELNATRTKQNAMPNRFLGESTPVVVTSFGYEVDGEIERVYYVLKLQAENSFLCDSCRPLWKKSWGEKLAKACLWNSPEEARLFARSHFNTVALDF